MSAYKAQAYTPKQIAELDKVGIKAQKEIKALPNYQGKELDLREAFDAIASHSSDFSEPNKEAEKVDQLLHAVLVKRGFFEKKAEKAEPQAAAPTPSVPTPQKSQKDILAAKIKTFETAWKYAKGDEKNKLAAKIKTFQTALKYAK